MHQSSPSTKRVNEKRKLGSLGFRHYQTLSQIRTQSINVERELENDIKLQQTAWNEYIFLVKTKSRL